MRFSNLLPISGGKYIHEQPILLQNLLVDEDKIATYRERFKGADLIGLTCRASKPGTKRGGFDQEVDFFSQTIRIARRTQHPILAIADQFWNPTYCRRDDRTTVCHRLDQGNRLAFEHGWHDKNVRSIHHTGTSIPLK